MSNNANRCWSQPEFDFTAANYLAMSDAKIGEALGRSVRAVGFARIKAGLLRTKRKDSRAKVAALWATTPPDEIAARLGSAEPHVRNVANSLGLGPSPFGPAGGGWNSAAIPCKPRGFTREQIAWAKKAGNRGCPEAVLIRGMAAEGILRVSQ